MNPEGGWGVVGWGQRVGVSRRAAVSIRVHMGEKKRLTPAGFAPEWVALVGSEMFRLLRIV